MTFFRLAVTSQITTHVAGGGGGPPSRSEQHGTRSVVVQVQAQCSSRYATSSAVVNGSGVQVQAQCSRTPIPSGSCSVACQLIALRFTHRRLHLRGGALPTVDSTPPWMCVYH